MAAIPSDVAAVEGFDVEIPASTARANASANASAVGNRSAGDFASAQAIASSRSGEIVFRSRRALGTGSENRLAITAWTVLPTYGGSPVI
ncbi:MAG TPA: hypothetical protein VG840_10860, partial [Casimicrobiaceae bacterium]|nr:hypothetical protein [Casimicrobiaceae bacterium]